MMSAPPGWHPDPEGGYRWWDGREWTDDRTFPQPPAPPKPASWRKLMWLGVALALLAGGGLAIGAAGDCGTERTNNWFGMPNCE